MPKSASISKVMRDPNVSIGARLLWWELNQWVTDYLKVCFPTQAKLAENLGVHRSSIIRWLAELRGLGLVVVTTRGQGITLKGCKPGLTLRLPS